MRFIPYGMADRMLSVLPLHHTFEFTIGFLAPMRGGAQRGLRPRAQVERAARGPAHGAGHHPGGRAAAVREAARRHPPRRERRAPGQPRAGARAARGGVAGQPAARPAPGRQAAAAAARAGGHRADAHVRLGGRRPAERRVLGVREPRHHHGRGLRPHGVLAGGHGQPVRPPRAGQRGAPAARGRDPRGRPRQRGQRRGHGARAQRHARLLRATRRPRPRPCATGGSSPATWAASCPTGACASPGG